MSHGMFRGLLQGGAGGGGGGSFTPDTSAYLHYHAMAITPQADGSTLAYTSVLDQSGNARHTTGSSGTIQYATNGLGTGKPAIAFGGPAYFTMPSLAALTAGEIFIVVKDLDESHGGLGSRTSIGHFGTNSFDGILWPFVDGNIYDGFGSTSRPNIGNPTPSLNTARLYNGISTSSEKTTNLDTTQIYTTASNTVSFPSDPSFGGQSLAGNGGFTGWIGEIRLFSSKRTAPQRAAIEADIKAVWGLTGY